MSKTIRLLLLTGGLALAFTIYIVDAVKTSETTKETTGEAVESEDSRSKHHFGTLTDDRDGKTYKTVQIGSQTWMAENLNYFPCDGMWDDWEWNSTACYNDDSANCEKYGRLYTWAFAMDSAAYFSEGGKGCGDGKMCSPTYLVRGVCPEGWHLPSDAEWLTLEEFVASSLGYPDGEGDALKSASGWKENYNGKPGNGSDAFGFGALPAGYRYFGFKDVLEKAYFWSSTECGANDAYFRSLYYYGTGLRSAGNSYKDKALSVRCVKDP